MADKPKSEGEHKEVLDYTLRSLQDLIGVVENKGEKAKEEAEEKPLPKISPREELALEEDPQTSDASELQDDPDLPPDDIPPMPDEIPVLNQVVMPATDTANTPTSAAELRDEIAALFQETYGIAIKQDLLDNIDALLRDALSK